MAVEIDRRIIIFILASIALIVLPHSSHIPVSLLMFFYSLLIWRFCALWDKKWMPKKWLVSLLSAIAIYQLYSLNQGVFGRDAGTSIFITALGLKILESNKEQDFYLVSYLAFVVASSQFLYSQSILMLGYILFVTCSLFAALITLNTKNNDAKPAIKKILTMTAQAIPITLLLFFLFPRIDPPDWLLFNQKNTAVSGLSDTLRPGSISKLGFSHDLVFRVKFKGKIPPVQALYWRGPVFSQTDGLNWTETNNRHFLRQMDKLVTYGQPNHYTVMMEPQDGHWIFTLDMPTVYPKSLIKNGLFQLLNPIKPKKREQYEITSYLKFNTGKLTDTEYSDNTQLPGEPMPEVTQLVNKLKGNNDSAKFLISAIFNHFKSNDFSYTLNPPVMEVNPIETFLFKARSGFCGHYATAFVYLLRVAKIPARVVSGYQGGNINKVGNFLEVKQSDAHAWAEVWLENKGWVRFDPTSAVAPDQFSEQNLESSTAKKQKNFEIVEDKNVFSRWVIRAGDVWSNMDYEWQQWIIHYRGEKQSDFLSSWGISGIKSMFYWLTVLVFFILGLFTWIILRNQKTNTDKVLIIYQQFCDSLAKVGLLKMKAETAHDFALRAKQLRPDLANNISLITLSYINLQYKKDSGIDDFKVFKRQVNSFKV
jgi:transglutaminase-like putative cysteine protease